MVFLESPSVAHKTLHCLHLKIFQHLKLQLVLDLYAYWSNLVLSEQGVKFLTRYTSGKRQSIQLLSGKNGWFCLHNLWYIILSLIPKIPFLIFFNTLMTFVSCPVTCKVHTFQVPRCTLSLRSCDSPHLLVLHLSGIGGHSFKFSCHNNLYEHMTVL